MSGSLNLNVNDDNKDYVVINKSETVHEAYFIPQNPSVIAAAQSITFIAAAVSFMAMSNFFFASSIASLATAFSCDKLQGSNDYKNTKMVAGALGISSAAFGLNNQFLANQTVNAIIAPLATNTKASKVFCVLGAAAPLFVPNAYKTAVFAATAAVSISVSNYQPTTKITANVIESAGNNVAANIATSYNAAKSISNYAQQTYNSYVTKNSLNSAYPSVAISVA